MAKVKPNIFNNYGFQFELLLLVFVCFLTVCCERKQTKQVLPENGGKPAAENAVNINTATIEELEKLPSIGPKRAQSIVDFRGKYGKFLKPEELILVDGMSDRKFRRIRDLVKTE